MQIFIVNETDEREEAASSGPLSAHIDSSIADDKAAAFNKARRGKADEIGHYAQVIPIELDLTGGGAALQQLRDEAIRMQARMARGRGRS